MSAVQRAFDLRIPTGRPLFNLGAAMGILDRSEDDILNLIEVGLLRWAFDIRGLGARCAEWRIWRQSIVDYANSPVIPERRRDQVIASILPKPCRTEIGRMQLARALNCSHTHVCQLIDAGELVAVPGSGRAMRSGGIYGQLVTRASVEAFLCRRSEISLKGNNNHE